jgi:hypothetical protein
MHGRSNYGNTYIHLIEAGANINTSHIGDPLVLQRRVKQKYFCDGCSI